MSKTNRINKALQDNIAVASANIRYLYDNFQTQSYSNRSNVYEEDSLKISIALYNTGPGNDFATGYRIDVSNGLFDPSG